MGLTSDRNDPDLGHGVGGDGMNVKYLVLSEKERAHGFIRPIRLAYIHERCGTKTSMHRAIAETYARNPQFYGSTYCGRCRSHFRVGAAGEFTWDGSDEKVGT